MKITSEPLADRQLSLTIELDEEQTSKAMRAAARQIARQVNIRGFRKGKAPYEVIVQRFGEDVVRREAADLLSDEVYGEALDQEGIEPYAPGKLDELLLDPITFKLTIPLRPMVNLGDYRDYRLKPRMVRVYKKEIEEALEKIREDHAFLEPVDRPVALTDGAVLHLVARSADGAEILNNDDFRVILEVDSTDPAPGFAEAIVGMKSNERRGFTLTLPEDFPQEEFRGQEAEFTVRLTAVYAHTIPELDDDLARATGNFDSLEELEKHVRDQLRQTKEAEADQEYTDQVVKTIVEQAQVEYPPAMLEKELDAVVQDTEQSLRRETGLLMDDYLRIQGQSMDEFRERLLPRAADRLRRGLVLSEIVGLEGLELDVEEVSTRIDEVSATWGRRADDLRESLQSDEGQRAIRSRMLASKAVERLIAIAKREMPEAVSDEGADEEEGTAREQESEGAEEEA